MKKLVQLRPHFSKPMGVWDPVFHRASANPGSNFNLNAQSVKLRGGMETTSDADFAGA